ncbi:GNAT family N-acetyltransferase [Gordonia sp. SL306]|uniref:GNAT family N-acetyltransferase n=1 Tax=Gordonia sp. SL306 TaxID=2995145 RepID=UPI00226ED518|nr:GNAT family N-acetyltransferase [Gordonia sp. SL306]WAC57600.1 GNAT family N-acetyltransferase [Gordonia sp. SL306]
MESSTSSPLDNPALAALAGPHARFAERHGNAVRYQPDVCPMAALPDNPTIDDWADAAALVGAGTSMFLPVVDVTPPADWGLQMRMQGVQMVDDAVTAAPDDEAIELTTDDVPEMLDLVRRTEPGPFLPRTIELGTYLGIRRGGRLVAMGGERLHLPGWTEISAVCTDPDNRGQGLGSRLIRALAHAIRLRGEVPFLHASAANTNAIHLYETLGFVLRREVMFQSFMAPQEIRR